MKRGIHSQDWDKLVSELKEKLPSAIFEWVLEILEKYSTNYL